MILSHFRRSASVILLSLATSASAGLAQAEENTPVQTQEYYSDVIGISDEGDEIYLPVLEDNDALEIEASTSSEQNPPDILDTWSIIGSDDRNWVKADPAIVQIQRRGRNHCTGWMISNDTLVTAAHCLYNATDKAWTSQLTFRPSNRHHWSYIPASQKWVSAQYYNTGASDHDWGVVKFSRPFSSSWFGVRPSDTASSFNGEMARVTGFPGEKGKGIFHDYGQLWSSSGRLQNGTPERLCYAIDTTGGQSGSPVYQQGKIAIGIHTHGVSSLGCQHNSGLRISPTMYDIFNDLKEKDNGATPDPGSSSGSSSY